MKPKLYVNILKYPGIVLFILCLFVSQSVTSQSIGNWNFNGILTGTPGLYNTVSTADFSGSVPIHSFNGSTEYYGENGWPTGGINTSMYMQFSLTPVSGYQLDISSIVMIMRRSNTGSPAGSGPTSWSIRSSLDGFTTDIAAGTMTHNYATFTVTPGSGFTNIYTTVTFRVYGYTTSIGSGGNSRFVFDNIRVNGIGYVLPSKLGAFAAVASDQKVNLGWTVYQTEPNDGYMAERSVDGINFTTIYTARETDNLAEKKYGYTDDVSRLTVADQLFYRLRLVNSSGAITYSPVVTVKIKNRDAAIKIAVINQQLYINGIFPAAGSYQAEMYSTSGQLVNRISFSAAPGYHTFVFNVIKQIRGACVLHISNGKEYSNSIMTIVHNP